MDKNNIIQTILNKTGISQDKQLEEKTLDMIIKRINNDIESEELSFYKDFPYSKEYNKFTSFSQQDSRSYQDGLDEIISLNNKTPLPFNKDYWKNIVAQIEAKDSDEQYYMDKDGNNKDIEAVKTIFLREWEKNINFLIENWELKKKDEIINKYLEKYNKIYKGMQKAQEILNILKCGYGKLWDNSLGILTENEFKNLNYWLEYLENNEEVKEICKLLGRMTSSIENVKKKDEREEQIYTSYIPRAGIPEEVVGITTGNNLEHILPGELAYLDDSVLELIFDTKFIEKTLLCRKFIGYEEQKYTKTIFKEKAEKGPMIICVDTSGSMHGTPEHVAKAISLYLVSNAVAQKRKCSIVNFSTQIDVSDFTEKSSIVDILNFLKKSFHGGTDILPALSYSLEKVQENDFKNSDILIISDFVMNDFSENLKEIVENIKDKGNKLYSLSIGNLFLSTHLTEIFDSQYVYNYHDSKINILSKLNDKIFFNKN